MILVLWLPLLASSVILVTHDRVQSIVGVEFRQRPIKFDMECYGVGSCLVLNNGYGRVTRSFVWRVTGLDHVWYQTRGMESYGEFDAKCYGVGSCLVSNNEYGQVTRSFCIEGYGAGSHFGIRQWVWGVTRFCMEIWLQMVGSWI